MEKKNPGMPDTHLKSEHIYRQKLMKTSKETTDQTFWAYQTTMENKKENKGKAELSRSNKRIARERERQNRPEIPAVQ